MSPCEQMAIVTRAARGRSSGRGRGSSRGPARSAGRSASRAASAAKSARRQPAGRGAPRGSARTTSPRPRGRSSPRNSRDAGDGGDGSQDGDNIDVGNDDVNSVDYWRNIATDLVDKLTLLQDSTRGNFQQIQRELDDIRVQRSGAAPGGDTASAAGSDDEVAYTGTGRAPMDGHREDAIPTAPQDLSAARKLDIREWRNLSGADRRLWFVLGGRPVNGPMSLQEMTVCLRHVALVTKDIVEQVNTLSGFKVQTFVGVGDEPGIHLGVVEHLQVLISVIGTFLRQQASGSTARDRVARVEAAFEVGLRELRAHVSRFRQKLQNPANEALLTERVNQSINEWSAQLIDAAGRFGQRHRSGPPAADAYPDVSGPDFADLFAWFRASGLGVLPDPPQRQQVALLGVGAKKSASSRNGPKSGYCYLFQSGLCPKPARRCRYIHELDPSRSSTSTSGSGSGGRGGPQGGSAAGGGGGSSSGGVGVGGSRGGTGGATNAGAGKRK